LEGLQRTVRPLQYPSRLPAAARQKHTYSFEQRPFGNTTGYLREGGTALELFAECQ
jgi:hypothetical protein